MEINASQMIRKIQASSRKEIKKRRQRFWAKSLKVFLSILLLVLLALVLWWYSQSDYSKIHEIEVVKNRIFLEDEILDLIGIQEGDSLFSLNQVTINNKLGPKSMARSIRLEKNWFSRKVRLVVEEKPLVGYYLTDRITLVANDGAQKELYTSQMDLISNLVRFSNFEKHQVTKLVEAIGRADPILYSNISEIIRQPKSYDENYLKLVMSDGILVNTDLYSFENLTADLYTNMINRLDSHQKCLVYDVFWKSSYAKPCAINALEVRPKEEDKEGEEQENQNQAEGTEVENGETSPEITEENSSSESMESDDSTSEGEGQESGPSIDN